MPLSHTEVIGPAVDSARSGHMDARIRRLVKRAGPRYPQADPRTIDLVGERRLDGSAIASLDAGNYPGQRLNVVFQGATGSGKSHLLCALAKSACRARYRAVHIRMPDLVEQVSMAADRPGGVPRRPCADTPPTTRSPSTNGSSTSPTSHSNDSHPGLMELRHDTAGTAFATRPATKERHTGSGGDTIADAILDRIVHNTIWIDTGEYNMRQHHGQTMPEPRPQGKPVVLSQSATGLPRQ